MQLSEQAKAALERRRQKLESIGGFRGVIISDEDSSKIADEMLRLFPVKTLNGMVIRWDDEITPERLVASGGKRVADLINWRFRQTTTNAQIAIHVWHTETDGLEWEVCGRKLPWPLRPTNMNEVWQLMAKCGCAVGGE